MKLVTSCFCNKDDEGCANFSPHEAGSIPSRIYISSHWSAGKRISLGFAGASKTRGNGIAKPGSALFQNSFLPMRANLNTGTRPLRRLPRFASAAKSFAFESEPILWQQPPATRQSVGILLERKQVSYSRGFSEVLGQRRKDGWWRGNELQLLSCPRMLEGQLCRMQSQASNWIGPTSVGAVTSNRMPLFC